MPLVLRPTLTASSSQARLPLHGRPSVALLLAVSSRAVSSASSVSSQVRSPVDNQAASAGLSFSTAKTTTASATVGSASTKNSHCQPCKPRNALSEKSVDENGPPITRLKG